ncbi:tRNA (N6-isopentenyl adenosine(37)-C2)-methylthiotransferase MiaB [Myxococcota bacterium]|nr:tRNA (N6-isopentenyl adenosine(37)-C2)-methylthiotransferase MiaB [Myxococcota bacterium]MBU1433276.1 tRNA (N6-isopentenyl adenosine(37)-C2)-methylthiotransferase MiaB [Myxococcota bacterium]MBU1899000.1 tRNA (N6-isopentenyl adenosine(37)-C2)-methylthiotransferase MiaB [Myxococcota bacterium]
MSRSVYIETYGCQMNESDTELMYGLLRHEGYRVAERDEDADVILLNTCTVRERAEERIFGRLGWLKSLKAQRPHVILGVTGCMAERMKEGLHQRAPYVDLIVGPDAYRRLPEMIQASIEVDPRDPQIDVRLDRRERYQGLTVDRVPRTSGWLTIQRGCDKFCAYCIVPFVRGRERSLPPTEVVAQAEAMVAQGFKEITLLGQTVSSYYEQGCDFAELLQRVAAVDGLARLRFMSPYPNDFSDRLIDTLASLPQLGAHLHLPMQSGSTAILKDMRRGYSAESFKEKILKIKERLPLWSLTTDVIVGYPGESDADFEATLEMMRELEFDSAFMFQYSEREGTPAARNRPDDVPPEVKGARLQALIALQEEISKARFAAQVGRTLEVLMTGPSRRDPARWIGRSSCFRTVILDGVGLSEGDMVKVKIEGATSHTLFGARG